MERIERLKNKTNNLPQKPGVYLMKDKSGKIIYVGKAKALKSRVSSYFRNLKSHSNKVKKMVELVDQFDFIITDTEEEALVLECSLIKQYSPHYNILLKDDKGYHYISVTNDEYPKIKAVKSKDKSGSLFLGPYSSSFVTKQTVEEVNRVFMLPTCNKKLGASKFDRPCLNFYIKRCSGACKGKIKKDDYKKTIDEAIKYIKSGSVSSIDRINRQMEIASENQDFELAIKLRDRIIAIKKAAQNQKIFLKEKKDIDVISLASYNDYVAFAVLKFKNGRLSDKSDYLLENPTDKDTIFEDFIASYYSINRNIPKIILLDIDNFDTELYGSFLSKKADSKIEIKTPKKGELKKLCRMAHENATELLAQKMDRKSKEIEALDELKKILALKSTPIYIESYDVSNLGDSGIVGGMVVFENGLPLKRNYKKFKINETVIRDDYASMKEMVRRRIENFKKKSDEGFSRKPDLILIDGGTGHMSVIGKLLKETGFDVPAFGMVKDNKHKTRAIANGGVEISVSSYKSAFRLLNRIQDEVHRFTISYQRKVRNKSSLSLELTVIDGIGNQKASALIKHFGSKKALKSADPSEIAKVARVSKEKANEVVIFINNI